MDTLGQKSITLDNTDIRVAPGRLLSTPLLVWIDDNPEHNAYDIAQARGAGIQVIELNSTAMAKSWVEANSGELRRWIYRILFSDALVLTYSILT